MGLANGWRGGMNVAEQPAQGVMINSTSWRHLTGGVPQGSTGRQMLFDLYIKNLHKGAKRTLSKFRDIKFGTAVQGGTGQRGI